MRGSDTPRGLPVDGSGVRDVIRDAVIQRIRSRVAGDESRQRVLAAGIGMSVDAFAAALDGGQLFSMAEVATLATAVDVDIERLVTAVILRRQLLAARDDSRTSVVDEDVDRSGQPPTGDIDSAAAEWLRCAALADTLAAESPLPTASFDGAAQIPGCHGIPAAPLPDGDRFAGYTIERRLGKGGMGEVYLVHHPRLPRREVLKVLPAVLTNDREFRERFDREAEIAASLWHPHIVGVHDRGEFDGRLWISMDYVEGTDAARRLCECPLGLAPDEVFKIVAAVAEALDYAHQHHLLHRDVKPANILVAHPKAGIQRIMLADFGIALCTDDVSGLTETNMTMGTMPYMAPEQLQGCSIDGRTDQYALAATAFHLLTGSTPFHPTNTAIAISQRLTSSPPKLAERCPTLAVLDPALSTALAKEPGSRFESCVDFAHALGEQMGTPRAKPWVNPLTARASRSPEKPAGKSKWSLPNWSWPWPPGVASFVCAGLLIAAIAVAVQLFTHNHEKPVPASALRPPSAPVAPTPTSWNATVAPSPNSSSPAPTSAPAPEAPAPPAAAPPPPSVPPAPTRWSSSPAPTSPAPRAAPPPSLPPPPPPPPLASAVVGGRCPDQGGAGVTPDGATVYCSHLQDTDRDVWSLHQGEVPNPLATAQPVAPQYGVDNESAVRVCVQQTGHTVQQCINDILHDNGFGS